MKKKLVYLNEAKLERAKKIVKAKGTVHGSPRDASKDGRLSVEESAYSGVVTGAGEKKLDEKVLVDRVYRKLGGKKNGAWL